MTILGIGGSAHDFSCAIIVDGDIVISIEEERISKEKNCRGLKSKLLRCIDYCLNATQITLKDVDYIIGNDLLGLLSKHHHLDKIIYINHHLAHCASSYYTSGMDEAAGLVIDGSGTVYSDMKNDAVSWYKIDRSSGISLLGKMLCDPMKDDDFFPFRTNSIGFFYAAITKLCGFESLQDGKTMGLASYGKPTYEKEIDRFIQLDCENGKPHLRFDCDSLIDYGQEILKGKNIQKDFEVYADLAYAGQAVLEKTIFKLMNYIHSVVKTDKLVYAGGVALNSVLNGKIKKKTPFRDVYIYPAAGDAGTGVGAALYMYYHIMRQPYTKHSKFDSVFLGSEYKNEDVLSVISKYSDKINFTKCTENELCSVAAQKIYDNHIIGWYQGRTEVGPRALGNRSILANPMNAEMKDILNHRVKFREHFRPFAPAVLKEHISEFFDDDFIDNPYMLFVADVHEDKKEQIPAVVHVDGTARLQTVSHEDNRRYYKLINSFYGLSNIPMVINTSFNIKSKPIVETPNDAMMTFLNCDMDDLFLHDYHITKKKHTT